MSDALTAAGMICDAIHINNVAEIFQAARARRGYETDSARLRAWNDWLARNLEQVCAEYGKLVDTANGREAEYRSRIAELERQNADMRGENHRLEGRYQERDALAVQDAAKERESYNRLVEKHKSILDCYRTLLMSVPPEVLAGNPQLLADYETVRDSGFKREGG